jgi:O-antigen ligase
VGPVQDQGLVVLHRLTAVGTVVAMSRPTKTRNRRRLLALVLAAVAIVLVIVEPFPEGEVLLSLTHSHGVDAGDLPAVALLMIAACLAI